MREIHTLQSARIRSISEYLLTQGHKITFFGKAWGNSTGDWVYFDTILNMEVLRSKFDPEHKLSFHENLDPRSGMERGFIDEATGEAVMGILK